MPRWSGSCEKRDVSGLSGPERESDSQVRTWLTNVLTRASNNWMGSQLRHLRKSSSKSLAVRCPATAVTVKSV